MTREQYAALSHDELVALLLDRDQQIAGLTLTVRGVALYIRDARTVGKPFVNVDEIGDILTDAARVVMK